MEFQNIIKFASYVMLCVFLASCGGGSTLGSNGSIALSVASATVNAGNATSAAAIISTTKVGALNNIDVTFSSTNATLIHFATVAATNYGNSELTVKTDTVGKAFVVINVDNSVSIPSSGIDVTITASSGSVSAISTIHVNPSSGGGGTGVLTSLKAVLAKTTIITGSDQSLMTVTATDSGGIPVPNKTINFICSNHDSYVTLIPQNGGTTDADGKAYAIVSAASIPNPATVLVYATFGTVASNYIPLTVQSQGGAGTVAALSASIAKSTIIAGVDQSMMTVIATDANGVAVPNSTITFNNSPVGSLGITPLNGGVTDAKGTAYAIVSATTVPNPSTVLVSAQNGSRISNSLPITIQSSGTGSVTSLNLGIQLDKNNLTVGGQALATVTVTDQNNLPVPQKVVSLSTQGALSLVGNSNITTGLDGVAYAIVQATSTTIPTYGFITAGASTGGLSFTKQQSLSVNPAPAPGKPQLTLNIGSAVVDPSVNEVLATATVFDSTGAAVPNQAVTFTILSGPATVDPTTSSVATGIDGKALAKLHPSSTPFASNVLVAMRLNYLGIDYNLVATFQVNPSLTVALNFDKTSVNMGDFVRATVTVKNSAGTAMPNLPLMFDTTGPVTVTGTSPTSGVETVTDNNGTAVAVITPGNSLAVSNALVTVTVPYNGTNYVTVGSFSVSPSNIKLELTANDVGANSSMPSPILGSSNDGTGAIIDALTAGVNVKAKFSYADGVPIPNQTITFTALNPGLFWTGSGGGQNNGTSVTSTTTVSGEAWAVAVPGNFPVDGYVYFQASAIVGGTTYTQILPVKVMRTVTGFNFTLAQTSLVSNPNNQAVSATVTILDNQSQPVPNLPVTYSVISGPGTIVSGFTTGKTDAAGKSFTSIQPTTVTTTSDIVVQAQAIYNGATLTRLAVLTVNPRISLTIATDLARVDVNNGQVTATATLKDSNPLGSLPISNQPVTFTILAGPATITSAGAATTADGSVKALITTGNTASTTNVLVQVATTVNGQVFQAVTTFQIVRGGGTLTLSAPAVTSATVPAAGAGSQFGWRVIMPFTLLDANGNPRVGVPVNLSVFSSSAPGNFSIFTPSTVTTDAKGTGIFNIQADVFAAGVGMQNTESVVWRVQTNDTIPVVGYSSSLFTVNTAAQ